MKRHDRLTIFRNRHRARTLQFFRARVQRYFEYFSYDPQDVPVDWDGVRAARGEINRMLPRVLGIVEAADLHAAPRAVQVLQDMFTAPANDGTYQEILDVLDMAIGVYDAGQIAAALRTINPLHYVVTALAFVAGLPRRALVAIGLLGPGSPRIRPQDLARLEAAVSRLGALEQRIESRFADLREGQSQMFADQAERLVDVAERMDFVERVLAQQRPPQQLEPGKKRKITPV